LVELALHNPLPLLLQDALKFLSAATAFGLIFALWKRLRDSAPKAMHIATVFGLLAVGLLLANAALSLFAVSQAASRSQNMADGDTLNRVIGILGMGAIMVNGVWYLLVNWSARKSGSLPLGLCWLGLIVGAASLVPFLALGVLVLGIVWAVWLGIVLWNAQ
jgi:succinate dehydrogenase/fumarate reductase cytochrome b subunit